MPPHPRRRVYGCGGYRAVLGLGLQRRLLERIRGHADRRCQNNVQNDDVPSGGVVADSVKGNGQIDRVCQFHGRIPVMLWVNPLPLIGNYELTLTLDATLGYTGGFDSTVYAAGWNVTARPFKRVRSDT